MKISTMLDRIALGDAYHQDALVQASSLLAALKPEHHQAVTRYLKGEETASDGHLLQALAIALREVAA